MVKIRLKRVGAHKRPYYRVVALDARANRDGSVLEELGYYHPIEKENQVHLKMDNIQSWIKKGAQMSPTVARLVKKYNIS